MDKAEHKWWRVGSIPLPDHWQILEGIYTVVALVREQSVAQEIVDQHNGVPWLGWTLERPTKAGVYWNLSERGAISICEVDHDCYVMFIGDSAEGYTSVFDGLWYGPITPPALPQE